MATLSQAGVDKRLTALRGWTRDGNAIKKQYTFASFADAMAFANRVAVDAERADHHPDILVSYRRVTLTYSTHSEGGLTQKDFDGAAAADRNERP